MTGPVARRTVLLGSAISLILTAGIVSAGAKAPTSVPPTVTIGQGTLSGITTAGVASFNGIPYAAPPVGALRWKAPTAAPSWTGTRDATAFGNQCAQPTSQFGHQGNAEDCLYLNVQVPAGTSASAGLPVMVWIHGGAFITGEGWDYDASALATEGHVAVVTINYRLGLFGFMAHPALAAENAGQSGNYGIEDQQAAIAWVQHNIAAFGGNPNNVTIFGESAGGASVIALLASPKTPKIQRAIIESGAYGSSIPTLASAETDAIGRMGKLGCASLSDTTCLRALPAASLVAAVNPLTDLGKVSPIVDGVVLPTQPTLAFNAGQFMRVPVIDGSNHDEWRLFVSLYDLFGAPYPLSATGYAVQIAAGFGSLAPSVLAAYPVTSYTNANYADAAVITDSGFACGAHLTRALLAQYVPVFGYELTDVNAPNLFLPDDPAMPQIGAAHAAELPYIFPLLQSSLFGKGVAKFTPSQLTLAKSMRTSWTNFARYGRPLSPLGGAWPAFSVNTAFVQGFSPPSPHAGSGFVADHKCSFWKPHLLTNAGLPAGVPF